MYGCEHPPFECCGLSSQIQRVKAVVSSQTAHKAVSASLQGAVALKSSTNAIHSQEYEQDDSSVTGSLESLVRDFRG